MYVHYTRHCKSFGPTGQVPQHICSLLKFLPVVLDHQRKFCSWFHLLKLNLVNLLLFTARKLEIRLVASVYCTMLMLADKSVVDAISCCLSMFKRDLIFHVCFLSETFLFCCLDQNSLAEEIASRWDLSS